VIAFARRVVKMQDGRLVDNGSGTMAKFAEKAFLKKEMV
jgi:hypothetical protein